MRIEKVAQDEVHITCSCGYNEYMSPTCRCGECPNKVPTVCAQCGAKADLKIGDWAYCRDEDMEFQIQDILGKMLMLNDVVGYHKAACEPVEMKECPRCQDMVPSSQIHERYSYSVYAGTFCDECCDGYRDSCGPQGDPSELDEDLEPEAYYGSEMP